MNIKLLKELDFASIVASAAPVTESGKEMLKNYAGWLFSNEPNYALVNGFAREARNYSYDKGVMEALSKVAVFISERQISWNLASVCEQLETSRPAYDAISKNAVSQVSSLLDTLNESQVKQYIKAGALKNVQYIPEFRAICKSVYSQQITECVTPRYNVTCPVSFCENRGKKSWFQVAGRVYQLEKGAVTECAAPSERFARVNEILSYMTESKNALTYRYDARKLDFVVNENGITVSKAGQIVGGFKNSKKFDEWRDTYSRGILGVPAKTEFMRVTESISELYKNIDGVAKCDNVRVVATPTASFAIVEGSKNIVVNPITAPNMTFKSYGNIMEALRDVETSTGVNLQPVYEKRIERETKRASDKEMREQLAALNEARTDERRRRIERLTEQYKDNPMKLAILNKIAKEVSKQA